MGGGKTNSKNGILFLKSFEIYVFLCPLLYVRTAASSFDQKTKKSGHVDVNNYLFFLEKEKKIMWGVIFLLLFSGSITNSGSMHSTLKMEKMMQ